MLTDDCTILRYRAPAVEWTDALPLGNGRLGAMCFGGVGEDRFQLNENTCWSGTPETAYGSRPVTDGPERLAAARAALANGDVRAAEDAVRSMQGGNSQAFQPLADLWITQPAGEPSVYQRSLDMRSAVVSHTHSGPYGRVSQEAWIGSQALMVRRRLSRPARLRIRLTSPHPTATLDRPPASSTTPRPPAPVDQLSASSTTPRPPAPVDQPRESSNTPHPTAPVEQLSASSTTPHPTAAVDRPSTAAADQLVMTVRMPSDVGGEITYGAGSVTAMAGLRVLGAAPVEVDGDELVVDVDDELILVLAVVTDYIDPLTPPHGEIGERLRERLDDVTRLLRQTDGYATLRAAHEREHLRLFARAGVRLGPPEAVSRLDTTERLRAHAAGESDPALVALQFQYGRYLLISSSRPGGLPAGLQGLWNDSVRPPWNANYTTNINLEMNYWPALVTNLAECHLPLLDWLGHAAVRGREMTRSLYGLPGWTLHHNSDAWGFAQPAGVGEDEARWSFWPLAAAWLVRHAWEHHDYTGDDTYLPLLDGAAEFCLAWLREMPDGTLGTSPSTSPENEYVAPDGRPTGIGVSTTADLALIRALLAAAGSDNIGTRPASGSDNVGTRPASGSDNVGTRPASGSDNVGTRPAAGSDNVGTRPASARDIVDALNRIPRERVGADGRLAEWPGDVADAEPGHRHTSHLVGLFPGRSIDPDDTPELARAARRTLDARGLESTGWALAWRTALRARLRDAEEALAAIRRFLRPADDSAGVYRNLFCAHPPFQVDGNFGFTAGVAEMLLQSHRDEIHLLPCLPAEWAEGAFAGLRARGGVTVDATWSGGVPTEVRLVSDRDLAVTVRSGSHTVEAKLQGGVPHVVEWQGRTASRR